MTQEVETLRALAVSIVDRARKAGATDAEVYLRSGRESEIAVRSGKIETLTEGAPSSLGLRLWQGDRSASTYATDLSERAVDGLIRDTLELAALTDAIPEAALIDAEYLATSIPDLDLFDDALAGLSAADKLALVKATEEAALGADPRISRSGGASYGDLTMVHALATSRGFVGAYRETYVSFGVSVVADDEGGKKRPGSWSSFGRHRDQLLDTEAVGAIAAERAVAQLGSAPMPTGRVPVVFDRRAAAGLVSTLFSVIRGGAIERRSSFLVDRIGDRIGSELVTIIDDPTIPRGPGSRPFDGEGQPARRTVIFDEGVLRTYALNSLNARRLGLAPTGHSSRPASGPPGETSSNLFLAAGDVSPDAVIAGVEYGFYCESMMGFGFNAATGDFSRGAAGRLIENGKLGRPVSEITLSSNLGDIFANVDAVADDLELDRSTCAPTMRVSGMTVGGT